MEIEASRGIYPSKKCLTSWDIAFVVTGKATKEQKTHCAKVWAAGGEARRPPRKEDVMISRLKMLAPDGGKNRKEVASAGKKPRDLGSLVLGDLYD